MPRVSRRKLHKDVEDQMFNQFWSSISQLKDPLTVSSFFSDLLTDTERIMLAKRFMIAVLLLRGKKPSEIAFILKVSFTTIGSVGSWLKNCRSQTLTLLSQLSQKSDWEAVLDRVEGLLDSLPPRYGSNWSQAGKEKRQRRIKRSARQSLR